MALSVGEIVTILVGKGLTVYQDAEKAFKALPPKETRKLVDYAKAVGLSEGSVGYGVVDMVDAFVEANKT
jgi:hypothetical protein